MGTLVRCRLYGSHVRRFMEGLVDGLVKGRGVGYSSGLLVVGVLVVDGVVDGGVGIFCGGLWVE